VISIRGGLTALLVLSVLSSCATLPRTEGPPPTPDTITDLIMRWDAIERRVGHCNPAYREQYVQALKALSDSLAETAKSNAREGR
jgi:hypothetical protein